MPDELDSILDQAIKSYSAVEPSTDLAGRILYQSQLHMTSPRRGWKLALAIALPLAAAIALMLVFAVRMNLPKPPAPIASQPATPSIATPKVPETLAAATHKPAVPLRHRAHSARASNSWARSLPAPYS